MVLHLGRDSKEKRRRIYEEILSAPSASVITPEQATLDLERDIIETMDLSGLLFHEVTSFSRLLTRAMERYDCEEMISDVGKYLLLRRVVEELKDELPLYGKSFDKEGFYEELSSAIELFERTGILAQTILQLEESGRLKELGLIYQGYEKKIKGESFYEGAALDVFDKSPVEGLYSTDEVWILGYKALDYRQWRMLGAMNPHTKIHVVLSFEEDDIFMPTKRTKEALERAFSCRLLYYKNPLDERILFCQELLYEEGENRNLHPEVFSAKDPYTEAEFVGLHILKRMKEDPSLKYGDFKILVSDMESYDFVFRQIFTYLGLPLFSDRRRSILESPMIQTFLSLLRSYERGLRREEVLGFLKGYVPEEDWEELDLFENYCFSRGIGGKRFRESFSDEAMEALRHKFLGVLLSYEESFKKKENPANFEILLRQLLEELEFAKRLEEESNFYAGKGEGEQAQLLSQLWESLLELISQLSSVGPDEAISFSAYSKLIVVGLSKMSLGIIPPAVDRIRLATLFRSTHDPVDYLYFCGMNDGLLPREYAEALLLKEEDKRLLQEQGFALYDNFEHKEELDRLDLFTALSLVEKKYFFSYALADLQGKSKIPSIFMERIMERTSVVFYSSAHSDAYLRDYYPLNSSMSFRYGLRALRENREEIIYGLSQDRLDEIRKILEGPQPLAPLKRADKRLYLSISRLERFRRCPFQYFVNDDLKARKRKAYKIDVMDIGNFFHEIMEKAMADYTKGLFDRSQIPSYIKEISQELLKEKEDYGAFLSGGAGSYLLERSLITLEVLLDYLISQSDKSQFKPRYFEQSFTIEEDNYTFRGIIDRVDILGDHFVAIDYKTGGKSFDLNKVFQGIDLQLMLYIDGFRSEKPQSQPAGVFYFRLHDPIVEDLKGSASAKDQRAFLKYDGLFIGDESLALAYDPEVGRGILPLKISKKGEYYKGSKVLDSQQAEHLLQRSRDFAQSYVDKILEGSMEILPMYDPIGGPGFTKACDSCEYKAICRFDPRSPGANYDVFEQLSDTQIMEVL